MQGKDESLFMAANRLFIAAWLWGSFEGEENNMKKWYDEEYEFTVEELKDLIKRSK